MPSIRDTWRAGQPRHLAAIEDRLEREAPARTEASLTLSRVLGCDVGGMPVDVVVAMLAEGVERLRDRVAALELAPAPEEETP